MKIKPDKTISSKLRDVFKTKGDTVVKTLPNEISVGNASQLFEVRERNEQSGHQTSVVLDKSWVEIYRALLAGKNVVLIRGDWDYDTGWGYDAGEVTSVVDHGTRSIYPLAYIGRTHDEYAYDVEFVLGAESVYFASISEIGLLYWK